MLSRSDGFMLYEKLGVDVFSSSELYYRNMKVRLRVIRSRPNFYMIMATPTLVLAVSFILIVLLSRMIVTRREWTCLRKNFCGIQLYGDSNKHFYHSR